MKSQKSLKAWLIPLLIIYGSFILYKVFSINPLLFSDKNLSEHFKKARQIKVSLLKDPSLIITSKKSSTLKTSKAKPLKYTRTLSSSWWGAFQLVAQTKIQTEFRSSDNFSQGPYAVAEFYAVPDKGFIFLGDENSLRKYNLKGDLIWSFRSEEDSLKIKGRPIISNFQIFVTTKLGKLYAFDKKSGRFLWNLDMDQSISSAPILIKKRIYFTITRNKQSRLFCIDISNGKLLWKSGVIREVRVPHLSASNKIIFVTTTDFIYGLDAKKGNIIWKSRSQGIIDSPLIIEGKSVFVANNYGQIFALQQRNGGKKWSLTLDSSIRGAMTYIKSLNAIAVKTEDGYLHFIDSRKGVSKWKSQSFSTENFSGVSSVLLGERSAQSLGREKAFWSLWTSCKTGLCIYSAKTGTLVKRFSFKGSLVLPVQWANRGFWVTYQTKDKSKLETLHYRRPQKLDKDKEHEDK